MNNQTDTAAVQVAKVVTAWGLIGITSWAEAASFLAFIYSLWLIGEKAWKTIKPILQRRGWIAP
ncbi:hypothetical protein D3C87_475860 [compost metagenome]